jgi:phage shock protein A
MEQKPDDLTGMTAAEAKEYVFHYISALKLTEKKLGELDRDLEKWKARIELARSKGTEALSLEAGKNVERIRAERETLAAEIAELRNQIEYTRRRLPGLETRERSVDPDLLEQELLMAAGSLPGDEEKTKTDRIFNSLEQDTTAEAALKLLKEKIGRSDHPGNL